MPETKSKTRPCPLSALESRDRRQVDAARRSARELFRLARTAPWLAVAAILEALLTWVTQRAATPRRRMRAWLVIALIVAFVVATSFAIAHFWEGAVPGLSLAVTVLAAISWGHVWKRLSG